MTAAE